MTRLRVVPYDLLKRVAEAKGFEWVRAKGSHNTFRNREGKVVTIPDHGAQVITRPLLRKILRDMQMDIEEYDRLLG